MLKKLLKVLGMLLLVILLGLFIYNLVLSVHYKKPNEDPILSETENAEMVFIYDLLKQEGENIWPGLTDDPIPLIFFNEKYEFLYLLEPKKRGWTKVVSEEKNALPVFRKAANNPQAFAVEVEDVWVASIGTRNQMNRDLYWGIRKEVPVIFNRIFPFFIFKVSSGMHISGTIHEMFHVLEARQNESKFLNAEASHSALNDYPYNDSLFVEQWNAEGQMLAKALNAATNQQMKAYVDSFLMIRESRRELNNLEEKHINAERSLEWLEGLAKYAEYRSYILAAQKNLDEFKFKTKNAYWQMEQKDRLRRMGRHSGDNRFYHSGAAMAFILEKLNPEWKKEIMHDEIFLEDLVRKYTS